VDVILARMNYINDEIKSYKSIKTINNSLLMKNSFSNNNNIQIDLIEKHILFNFISTTTLVLDEKDIKTTSLEWTLPSPPPAHTFVVAPKIITTAKHYREYRWGAVEKGSKYNRLPLISGHYIYNFNNLKHPVHIFYQTQFPNIFLLNNKKI
jgi:heme/copper-type cytochrome/quinol oxidase subunit 1